MTTIDQVRHKAGTTIFERGLKLMQQDCFQAYQQRTEGGFEQVHAQVIGTQLYQVSLMFRDNQLESHRCTCPAASYQDICKHAVAVWLEWIDRQNSSEEHGDADSIELLTKSTKAAPRKPTPRKPTKREQELVQIRQWLEQAPKEQLVDRLQSLAERIPELRSDMAAHASLALSPPKASALSKHITSALPKRKGLWEYRKVALYFDNATARLEPAIEHLVHLPAPEAIKWCSKAMERLEIVLEQIDDSGGYRMPLESLLMSAIVQHYHRLDWSLDKRLGWLLEHQLTGDLFSGVDQFSLPEDELTAFYALAQQEFDAIEVLKDYRKRTHHERLQDLYWLLTESPAPAITDKQSLLMQAKMACRAEDYCDLANRWLKQGDELEAEDCLVRARSYPRAVHTDRNIRILQDKIDLASGKAKEVWEEQWIRFQKNPSFQRWSKLDALRKEYSLDQHMPDNWLETSERLLCKTAEPQALKQMPRVLIDSDPVLFYLANQHDEQCLQWAEKHAVDRSVLLQVVLTESVFARYPDRVLPLACQALDSHLGLSNKQAYSQVLEWLQKIRDCWGNADEGHDGFRSLLQHLRHEHGRKKTFIADLQARFGEAE